MVNWRDNLVLISACSLVTHLGAVSFALIFTRVRLTIHENFSLVGQNIFVLADTESTVKPAIFYNLPYLVPAEGMWKLGSHFFR